jgi:transposase
LTFNSQVARNPGISESALRRWVNQAKIDQNASPQGALTTTEHQELLQLRRDNKRLQMERDFIKKAAAFFAQDSSTLMS